MLHACNLSGAMETNKQKNIRQFLPLTEIPNRKKKCLEEATVITGSRRSGCGPSESRNYGHPTSFCSLFNNGPQILMARFLSPSNKKKFLGYLVEETQVISYQLNAVIATVHQRDKRAG